MVKAKKSSKKKQDTVQKIAKKTISLLGIDGDIAVSDDKENEATVVQIETDEAGILIGRHGETIGALQLVLNQIFYQKTGEWERIVVDVGDYRTRQKDSLENLAQTAAGRAKETGKPQSVFDLSAAERRMVHIALADDPDVVTESDGEGRDRHIIVKAPRKARLARLALKRVKDGKDQKLELKN